MVAPRSQAATERQECGAPHRVNAAGRTQRMDASEPRKGVQAWGRGKETPSTLSFGVGGTFTFQSKPSCK